jgi:hypothetical protein
VVSTQSTTRYVRRVFFFFFFFRGELLINSKRSTPYYKVSKVGGCDIKCAKALAVHTHAGNFVTSSSHPNSLLCFQSPLLSLAIDYYSKNATPAAKAPKLYKIVVREKPPAAIESPSSPLLSPPFSLSDSAPPLLPVSRGSAWLVQVPV